MGPVKLALVAAGRADVTFTLTPQERVGCGGGSGPGAEGFVVTLEKTNLTANRGDPLLSGLLACGSSLKDNLLDLVEPHIHLAEQTEQGLENPRRVQQLRMYLPSNRA
jgi:hypothetical protein